MRGALSMACVVAGALALAGCTSQGGGPAAKAGAGPTASVTASIEVTSPAFENGGTLPAEFTCHGAGKAPTIAWHGVPADATSLALVVTDPDAPGGTYVHWLVYDLLPGDSSIAGGTPPASAHVAANSAGTKSWTPPCPPSGTHHYHFTVYALNTTMPVTASTKSVLDTISSGAIAEGTLVGLVSAS